MSKKQQKQIIDELQNELKSKQIYLDTIEREFNHIQKSSLFALTNPNVLKRKVKNSLAYIVGKRNLKRLYSESYKSKQASNDLKAYLKLLYEEGFTEDVLKYFEEVYRSTKNMYVKRAIAWELLFWHANKQTKVGAKQALLYFFDACIEERDPTILQNKLIITAECLVILGWYNEANSLLNYAETIKSNENVLLGKANAAENLEERVKIINKIYKSYDLEEIQLQDNEQIPYARLQAVAKEQIIEEERVSIIVPAYNAEQLIHVTLESLMTQTWKNIEIIVVDDCSSDKTTEVVKAYMKQDERISLYQTPSNSGAYTARNIGLLHAKGEFVTVNDADDWSHPRKIEVQMKHLLNNPKIIANTSQLSRITEQLYAYRRGTRGKYIFSNMSSLLFRRKKVMDKLGFWDSVRFAADGEFKRRLIHTFGKEAVIDLQTGPLSLALQSENSLTASSAFGYHGAFVGVRKEYVESFQYYYEKTGETYYPYPMEERPFPVPKPMLPNYKKGSRYIDIVIVADFYKIRKDQLQLIEKEIKIHQSLGMTTGLVHVPVFDQNNFRPKIDETVRNWIDGDTIQLLVYGEIIETNLIINHNMLSFERLPKYIPEITSLTTLNVIDKTIINDYNKRNNKVSLLQLRNNYMTLFNRKGNWFYLNEKVQNDFDKLFKNELKYIPFRQSYWENDNFREAYINRLETWNLHRGGDN